MAKTKTGKEVSFWVHFSEDGPLDGRGDKVRNFGNPNFPSVKAVVWSDIGAVQAICGRLYKKCRVVIEDELVTIDRSANEPLGPKMVYFKKVTCTDD